jgi:DNA repair photolyase
MADKKLPTVHSKDKIQSIPGHNHILLIAPHGHDKDDENTGALTRLVAEQSGSYAIINETYRRAKSFKTASKKGKRVNLNHLAQVKKHLEKELLDPLLDFKNKIVKQYDNALIFWIHGADDLRLEGDISDKDGVNPKDIKVLVGWGQKTGKNRHTAEQETKDILFNALNENGLNAVLANPDKKVNFKKNIRSYCGWDINNLNQMFRSGEYKDVKVESFQLEFRKMDCRDNEENIKSTAESIASAISILIKPVPETSSAENTIKQNSPDSDNAKNEHTKKEASEPTTNQISKITDPSKTEGAIDKKTQASSQPVGENAVTEAGTESATGEEIPAQDTALIHKMTEADDREGAIDVGEGAVKIPKDENDMVEVSVEVEIVEEDPKVEEAYKYVKSIFVKYISKAMLEVGQYLIGQFYDGKSKNVEKNPIKQNKSLNQLFDKLQTETSGNVPKKSWLYNSINLAIAEDKYNGVSIYGKLGQSHKLVLIGQKKIPQDKKIKLMEKTVDKKWTVLQLQEEINKKKNADGIKLDEPISKEDLKGLDVKRLTTLKKQTEERKKKIKGKLNINKGNLTKIKTALINKPQIISVSRRTDIPAVYSEWFFNRIKKGFALYKAHVSTFPKSVSLIPEDVLCFVFWTKNPGPMMDKLHLLDKQGYKYYFQVTLNPYGPDIQRNLPPKDELVETFIALSKKIGKKRVIWRYDPILLTDEIDIEYHKKHFADLAKKLHNHTERCVISFVDAHQISQANGKHLKLNKIDPLSKELQIATMKELARAIHQINKKYGLTIQTCAEKIDLTEYEITSTKCIDDKLIGGIIDRDLAIPKDSQRKECGCVKSIDIGTHKTCTKGCLYCYATKDHAQAQRNHDRHEKTSPLLIGNIDMEAFKKDTKKRELRRAVKNNEWTLSKNNFNFSTGCSNDCLYCYGRYMPFANKLAKDAKAQGKEFLWGEPTVRQDDVNKSQSLRNGRVGFPTSHDITPENLIDYLKVLGKLLKAGNSVMIITKPDFECVKAICEASYFFKKKILFRFTITAKSADVIDFWEPHAPSYEHRIECLKYAYDEGFQTSVSVEPLLEYDRAQEMVDDFMPHVTDAIWFGKMSQITDIKKLPKYKDSDGRLKTELEKVEAGHSVENIKALYAIYKGNPKIKWKLAYKDVLGIPLPPAPGMDI